MPTANRQPLLAVFLEFIRVGVSEPTFSRGAGLSIALEDARVDVGTVSVGSNRALLARWATEPTHRYSEMFRFLEGQIEFEETGNGNFLWLDRVHDAGRWPTWVRYAAALRLRDASLWEASVRFSDGLELERGLPISMLLVRTEPLIKLGRLELAFDELFRWLGERRERDYLGAGLAAQVALFLADILDTDVRRSAAADAAATVDEEWHHWTDELFEVAVAAAIRGELEYAGTALARYEGLREHELQQMVELRESLQRLEERSELGARGVIDWIGSIVDANRG